MHAIVGNGVLHVVWIVLVTSCDALPQPRQSEFTPQYWMYDSIDELRASIEKFRNLNTQQAKNVILFIGDGMGLTSITAGRIFKGQKENKNATGEEYQTSIDSLPHSGLLKTYSVDHQTPDSAATATALLCGFKTKSGMVGVQAREAGNCTSLPESCIIELSKISGKATGIVTTARVQHAIPAAAYSKALNKRWYSDLRMSNASKEYGCKDISVQLLENAKNLNVLLGGGRAFMKPFGSIDREYPEHIFRGERLDRRDLIEEWFEEMDGEDLEYVWNKDQFDEVDPGDTDYLLGLFEPYDMRYSVNRDRDGAGEPSLAEMTEKAISILQKDKDGFVLIVHAGRIDHAHHANKALVAMEEFVDLEEAVAVAKNMTEQSNTLFLVTANHGSVFTIGGGYPDRGNPILGLSPSNEYPTNASDGLFHSSAGYANGPGAYPIGRRPQVYPNVAEDVNHRFQATVPLLSETHSSEDVAVFASGPMSHLVTGVHEQSYLAELMFYAACLGTHTDEDHCA